MICISASDISHYFLNMITVHVILIEINSFILQGKGAGSSMFVQSLRGDPFRVTFPFLCVISVAT